MAEGGLGDKIKQVRDKFETKYNGSILDDTYDEKDVERVRKDNVFVTCALQSYRTGSDVSKCVDMLNDVLLFRAKWKLNHMTEKDLHPEAREKNGVYYHGTDKQGHKILHLRVCKQKKGHLVKESKRTIAFYVNMHYSLHPDQPIIFLFDFVDAGVGNMDMDVTRFIINCAALYFPSGVAYNLMFKMAPGLEMIWKMIKGLLDKDQAKKTVFVSRKNITEYIDEDQLLPHMRREEKAK